MFRGVRFLSIVMHRFMDAENVQKAWKLMEEGVQSADPKILETQERLQVRKELPEVSCNRGDTRLVKSNLSSCQTFALDPTPLQFQACSYAMAQPDAKRVVPACVQHSVYDPAQNKVLREMLPLTKPHDSYRAENTSKWEQEPQPMQAPTEKLPQ